MWMILGDYWTGFVTGGFCVIVVWVFCELWRTMPKKEDEDGMDS